MNLQSLYEEKNILDVVLILLYVLFIIKQTSVYLRVNKSIGMFSLFLGVFHFLMTFGIYTFVLGTNADAKHYYEMSATTNDWLSYFSTGTSFIIFLNYVLVRIFQLSFLGCFLVFSFISYLGCLKLFKIMLHATDTRYNGWYLLLLMPGLHFWTASLGKDALVFYAMSSICYNIYFNKSKWSYIIPVILIGFIRIHILIFIILGGGLSYMLTNNRIKLSAKVFLVGVLSVVSYFLISFFLDSMEISNITDVENKIQRSMNANMEGGGGVDVANSNIVFKWFSYMFRPFIFEASNALYLLSGVENIVWLFIFYHIILGMMRSKNKSYMVWSYIGIIMTCTLPLAYSLANFGISMRQKIMIYPFLLGLLLILKYHRKPPYENTISDKIHT